MTTGDEVSGTFARHRSLVVSLTWLLASAHVVLIGLLLTNRVTSNWPTIEQYAIGEVFEHVDDGYWVTINTACAVALIIGVLLRDKAPLLVMWSAVASFASWLVWSALFTGWALGTEPPVSLVGPLLSLAVVLPLALTTAWAWSDRD